MTFDAHQLDSVLLVGAIVMLVAILAVRVSVRAGLPSLLIYLLMGVALGESGLGVPFDNGVFRGFEEPLNAPWPAGDPLHFTADQIVWPPGFAPCPEV